MLKLTIENNDDSINAYIKVEVALIKSSLPDAPGCRRWQGKGKDAEDSYVTWTYASGHMVKNHMTVIQTGWGAT